MILSVSRRTDIPRYYADWFMHRIAEGFVLVRQPRRPSRITRIDLSPAAVEGMVFWSKDPAPLLPHLSQLDAQGYRYYFQYTLTPYGLDWEPGLRDKRDITDTFIALSRHVGRERVVWRYDPIVCDETHTPAYHRAQFTALCARLAPYTARVTVSFVDAYRKLRGTVREVSPAQRAVLAEYIGRTAREYGIEAVACCEEDLSAYGIGRAACVDAALLERMAGRSLGLKRDGGQRPGCGCCASVDIGAYDTCPAGCRYCYANSSPAAVRHSVAAHDPAGALLTGTVGPDDCLITPENHSTAQMTWY